MYKILKVYNNINGDKMTIEKIMTKSIITGNISNTLSEIAEIMKKYDIGFLPISDKNKIIGVITDRDIIVEALSNKESENDLIDKYLTSNIITIEQNKTVEEAIDLMGNKKIRRLIVTNNNKITGIISLADIIKLDIDHNLIIENLKKIFEINRNDDLFKTEIDEFYL